MPFYKELDAKLPEDRRTIEGLLRLKEASYAFACHLESS
jgi:hypothetical protein